MHYKTQLESRGCISRRNVDKEDIVLQCSELPVTHLTFSVMKKLNSFKGLVYFDI